MVRIITFTVLFLICICFISIDATRETGRMGRLINHSRTNSNLYTKTILVEGLPRLVLLAKENIKRGQELLYDYGDRSRESLKHHPWLKY